MNSLDAKSRNLLEKDSSNPNGGPRPASVLPAKSPAKSRTALQEAIAARKKGQMPSRPESAQPAFPEAKPQAAAKTTRTVPTGAPLSSLSSAPMRPGVKPRRAELSRPATADPYARRPESRAQSTNNSSASKPPTSSPRSVRSKPSTPNTKPLTAPRIRPHESNPNGTAKGRPKKLDLSKSKSHNDLGAASRARSDSNDSLTNHSSARTPRTPRTPRYDSHLSASEDQYSPAQSSPVSAVFGSPQLSASQPMLHSAPDGPHASSVPVDEPEPMVLEEYAEPAVMPPSPRIAEPDVAAPIDPHLIPVPESVSKPLPDSMVIYEDPATPTTPTTPTRAQNELSGNAHSIGHLTPSRSSIPMRSPIRPPVRSPVCPEQPEQDVTEPEHMLEDAPASVTASAKKPTPDLAPSHDSVMNSEARTPSPTRRAPLQPSPSPTRGRVQPAASNIVTGVDSMELQDPPVGSPETQGNDENATPHTGKVVDLPVPRSAAKPTALEEVPVNETTPRSADVRDRSFEAMSQSVLSHSTTSDDSPRRTRKFNDRYRSPSPRSKDPVNAREMIHKGLARITSRTMEPSGYRKLQALFQYHGDEIVPRSQEYNAMLESLLGELEAVPTSRKDHDVKTQVLATIRSMLLRTREHFHPYDTRAMSAFIQARQHYESSSHFVTCLEEVTDKLVFLTLPQTAIAGVLQALNLGDEENDETHRSIIMGLSTIQQSLSRPRVEIADDLLASIGAVVMQQLGHPRPGVRKSATELCTFLNLTFGSERVQKVTQPPREGSLNLLTYFMARRSQ